MLRIPLAILVTLLANLAYEPVQAAEPIRRINCEALRPEWTLDPVGAGPLQLAAVHCHASRVKGFSRVPLASPDARSIAYYDDDKIARIMRLDGSQTETDQNAEMSTFARFGAYPRSAPAVRWSSNGEFIWAASHETIRPNGFATSALHPIKLTLDGTVQALPELRHDAGPLDALLWVDGDGLAVAQFGTRGGYYRPEHDDKAPMFAIVDAERGLVRDTLPFSAIEAFEAFKTRNGGISPGVFVNNAVATKLPDGKVRAVLNVGQWIVWTEGDAPRALPVPDVNEAHNRMAISPDGSRLLIGYQLRTQGGMCDRTGGCKAGLPVEGVLADVRDLETGQVLWSVRATVTANFQFPAPTISPDGRYALVGLVPQNAPPLIALVTMTDGQIAQVFPSPGGDYAMGFARGGRTVWTDDGHRLTVLYSVRDDAR